MDKPRKEAEAYENRMKQVKKGWKTLHILNMETIKRSKDTQNEEKEHN